MPRVLYVSSGMMNNTVAAGTCLLALLILIHIKCLTLFNSNEVLISTVNAETYLWVWFIMNYDICLYCTIKGGAPTDSDPGWASEYVIGYMNALCIWYLICHIVCLFMDGKNGKGLVITTWIADLIVVSIRYRLIRMNPEQTIISAG